MNARRRGQPGYGLPHSARDSHGSKTAGKASRTWFDKTLRSASAERELEPERTGPVEREIRQPESWAGGYATIEDGQSSPGDPPSAAGRFVRMRQT